MTGTESERDYIQSIERGFAVLLAFDADRPNPSLAELATATGLSRPAVRRILLTLQRLGYVRGEGPRWRLTPRVLSIGQHYSGSHAMIEIAQPHLLALAEGTQESASLAALDGTEVVYVARVPVRRIMSINVSIG
ncbi:MAG: helix-turn-helix domain-containing protein, partial [Pseudonocardia sp.]